jgi:hypothetical protein
MAAAAPPLVVPEVTELAVAARAAGPWVIEAGRRLWLLPSDGGSARPITPPEGWARRPRFSADGQRLAWQSLVTGAYQIAVGEADGSKPQILTTGPWHHLAPAWSPDGQRLALATNRAGRFQVWQLDLASGALEVVSPGLGQEYDPAWHPSDGSIAYVSDAGGRHELVVQNPGTARGRAVLTRAVPIRAPAWRADGTVLSYTALTAEGPRLETAILSSPVVLKPAAPGESAALTPASWPERQQLVYAADGRIRQRELAARTASEVGIAVPLPAPPLAPPPPALSLPAAASPGLLLRAERVLNPAGDGWLRFHDVLVEAGRIVAIGLRNTLEVPPGTPLVDLQDRALVPGLVDTSLYLPEQVNPAIGATLLSYGITTAQARTGLGPKGRALAAAWWQSGSGPRLLAGDNWCGGPLPAAEPSELPAGAVRLCTGGADPVTLAGLSGPAAGPARAAWSPVWLAATSGRVQAIEYPGPLLSAPLGDGSAAGTVWYQDAIDTVLAARVPLVASAGGALAAVFEQYPDLLGSAQVERACLGTGCPGSADDLRAGPAARAALRRQRLLLGRVAAGGGWLVAASESPESPYGLGLHASLRLLQAAGVERQAALAAVTSAAAELLGLGSEVGSLVPGRQADLLVVDGDPLADLRHLLRIERVIVGGRVYESPVTP